MTVLVVACAAAGTWLILTGIKSLTFVRRDHHHQTSFLGWHQRDRRRRQLDEVVEHQGVEPEYSPLDGDPPRWQR